MNIGGLSRATHETWRGCQSILFPSRSLDLTQACGCSHLIHHHTHTQTQAQTKTAHTENNTVGNSCSY